MLVVPTMRSLTLAPAATGLVRRRWLDTIAAAPPVILIFVFKFWIRRMYGAKFRYFVPTPQEAEHERRVSMNEKRTRVAEMEKRFLHPALQHDKLFKIMVHKKSEEAVKELLSAYPWFGDKYDVGFIKIKGVREVSLPRRIDHRLHKLIMCLGQPRVRPRSRWTSGRSSSKRLGYTVSRFHRDAGRYDSTEYAGHRRAVQAVPVARDAIHFPRHERKQHVDRLPARSNRLGSRLRSSGDGRIFCPWIRSWVLAATFERYHRWWCVWPTTALCRGYGTPLQVSRINHWRAAPPKRCTDRP